MLDEINFHFQNPKYEVQIQEKLVSEATQNWLKFNMIIWL
jgi:hypothetical protein